MAEPPIDLGFEARIAVLEQRITVLQALNAAFIAMQAAMPRQREHPGDPKGFAEATTQHAEMLHQAQDLFNRFYDATGPLLPRR